MTRTMFRTAFRTIRHAYGAPFIVRAMIETGTPEPIARAARAAHDARGREDPLARARRERPHVLIDRMLMRMPGCGGRYACGGHCRDCR